VSRCLEYNLVIVVTFLTIIMFAPLLLVNKIIVQGIFVFLSIIRYISVTLHTTVSIALWELLLSEATFSVG